MSLKDFINKHRDYIFVYAPPLKETIESAEISLDLTFDGMLKKYFLDYGAIECLYLEFFGLGVKKNSYLNSLNRTMELREEGLPFDCIIISDLGDMHFAVCNTKNQIYEWAPEGGDQIFRKLSDNLEVYLIQAMSVAINSAK